jgi:hypothetical protein
VVAAAVNPAGHDDLAADEGSRDFAAGVAAAKLTHPVEGDGGPAFDALRQLGTPNDRCRFLLFGASSFVRSGAPRKAVGGIFSA